MNILILARVYMYMRACCVLNFFLEPDIYWGIFFQELRDAIIRFSANSGKPSVAYTETFGEGEPALLSYWFATGFSRM